MLKINTAKNHRKLKTQIITGKSTNVCNERRMTQPELDKNIKSFKCEENVYKRCNTGEEKKVCSKATEDPGGIALCQSSHRNK